MDNNRANGYSPGSVGGASHEGLKPTQEDRYAIHSIETADGMTATLLLVADGVGGQNAGELASYLAVQSVYESVLAAAPTSGEVATVLVEALRQANERLYQGALENPDRSGMATTFTAVAIVGNRLVLAHVGDSRAYLLRRGALYQLTIDHTWAEEAIQAGRPLEEVRRHPNRNVIKRYLGINTSVEVDTRYCHPENPQGALVDALEQPLFLTAEDSVFLCSDGVTDVLPPQTIARIMGRLPAAQAAQAIVDAALEVGASDNVTAVVMDMPQARKHKFALPKMALYAGGALLVLIGAAVAAGSWFSSQGEGVSPPPISTAATARPGPRQEAASVSGEGVVVVPAQQEREQTAAQALSATSTLMPMEVLAPSPSPTELRSMSTGARPSGVAAPSPSPSATAIARRAWALISPSEGPEWVHGEVVTLRWQCNPGLAVGEQFSLRIVHEGSSRPVLPDYRTTSTSYDFRPDPLKTGRYDWEVLIVRADSSQIVDRQGWHFSWALRASQTGATPAPASPNQTTEPPTSPPEPPPNTNTPVSELPTNTPAPPTNPPAPPTNPPAPPTNTPVPTSTPVPTNPPVPTTPLGE